MAEQEYDYDRLNVRIAVLLGAQEAGLEITAEQSKVIAQRVIRTLRSLDRLQPEKAEGGDNE